MRIRVTNVDIRYDRENEDIESIDVMFNAVADNVEMRSGRIVLTEDEYKGNESIASLESEVLSRLKGALADGK